MRHTTRWLSVLLALVLVFSLCTSALAVKAEPAESTGEGGKLLTDIPYPRAAQLSAKAGEQHKAGDQVRAIVLMSSKPTAERNTFVLRRSAAEMQIKQEHTMLQQRMQKQNVDFKVNFEYTAVLNGLSVTMDYADLDKVAAMPGVEGVVLAREYSLPETQPKADSAADMINATMMNQLFKANGSGKVIAILDTGITSGHEAFGIYPGMLQTPAYEKADMLEAIADIGHGVYVSQKIPYQFDYADNDSDATDDNSGHGSHVAGIAAGYAATEEGEVTFFGSAPDAQILAMKIFSSTEKTTSSDIYFAALEDAYKLGADVINMSIGAPNGFVEDDESVLNDRIYERLEAAGIICCVSAGNENTLAEYSQNWINGYGYQFVTADNVDFGVLGSPASYNSNVAVAAVENMQYPSYMINLGEAGFAYRDYNGTTFLDTFKGQDLEYVMVPNYGAAEDYADIDVTGKVAVISRGDITFAEKVAYASAAGAIAAVVYNNEDGALVSMAIENHTIPAVFVSQEAGAALAALEQKTFHVDDQPTIIDNPDAGAISTFSSWGPTNDLQIKPTISGVGGNVNSVLAGTTNGYEVQSGTSMSAPNVSGGFAALLEAMSAKYPDKSKAEVAELARNRVLSSATVLAASAEENEAGYYDITSYYSPRQQGAGLMDILYAYSATMAIDKPLVELGDSTTGEFTFDVKVENLTREKQTYDINVVVQTDQPTGANFGTQAAPDVHYYNTLTPMMLEAGEDYTIEAPESVTLAAGEKKAVTVKITLTDELKATLDSVYANGCFIDGYVFFEQVSADAFDYEHATFLGFYGDWSAAPIIETHDWRELMNVEIDPEDSENPMDYVDWEIDTTPTMAYLVDDEYNPKLYAGDAPLGYPEGGQYSDARIAVSNDADSAYFTKLLVVPTTIRNARHIVMIARNAETGEIYAVDDTPFCPKTIFDPDQGAFSTYAWLMFDGMDIYPSGEEPTPIDDDTNVVLEFYANLPYGEDELGAWTPEQIVANGGKYLAYTVPCVVDSAAPVIESCEYDPETGDVTVTVSDNQYLAAIYAMDMEGNDISDTERFADDELGKSHTVTLHVGDQTSFVVAGLDYATNEGYVIVSAPHEHEWSEWQVVKEPTYEEEGLKARYCLICYEEEYEAIPKLEKCDGGENCPSIQFEDVDRGPDSWMHEPIDWAVVNKITMGTSPTTFSPNNECTRGEAVTFLWRAAGCPEPETTENPFSDVADDAFYLKPVLWAVENEITLGTGDGKFSPNDKCTRSQIVTFLWRMHDKPEAAEACTFTDVSADDWFYGAVSWAVENGITKGTGDGTTFEPDAYCIRSQIVAFLYRDLG